MPLTVVTGGSRGIGAAVCRRLAREGHDVVVGFLHNNTAAERVADDVRKAGRKALAVQVDTTDERQVEALFTNAATLGTVTGLVNNAGSAGYFGDLANADIAAVRRDIDVDLVGVLTCAKHAIRSMPDGGAIVNISSVSAYTGSPGRYVHYAAAKAGVDAITIGLSKEVAPQGIRVNGVAPGTIWTEFHPEPDRPNIVAPSVPMGRGGQPEEIAGAVAWLLGPDASYTTGTTIRVSGGL